MAKLKQETRDIIDESHNFLDPELDDETKEEPINEDIEDEVSDDFFEDIDDLGGFDGVSTPPMERHGDLLKQLTDFAPYLKNTFNHWLGVRWSEKDKAYVEDEHVKPLMNINCASWCIGYLQTYARGNNIITTIRQQEYRYLMTDIVETVYLNIFVRHKEFGIEDLGDQKRVCTELVHSASLILMGAGDGQYNDLLQTTVSRTENYSGRDGSYGGFNPSMSNQAVATPKNPGLIASLGQSLLRRR